MTNIVIGNSQAGTKYWGIVEQLKWEFARIYKGTNMQAYKRIDSSTTVFLKLNNGIVTAIIFAGEVFICWNWLETTSGFENDWVKLLPDAAINGAPNTTYQQKLGFDRPFGLTDSRNSYWTDETSGLSWYANEIHTGGFKYTGLAVIRAAALLPGNSVIDLADVNTILILDLHGPVVTEEMTGLSLYSGTYTIRTVITGDGSLIGKNLVWAEFSKDLTYAVMVTSTAATYEYDGNILISQSGNIEFWRVDFSLSENTMTISLISSDSLDYHVPIVTETGRGTWMPYTYNMSCGPITKYTGNFSLIDGFIYGTYHTETLSMSRHFFESEQVHIEPTGTYSVDYEIGVFRVDVTTGEPTTFALHTYQRSNVVGGNYVSNGAIYSYLNIYLDDNNVPIHIITDAPAHRILYVNYKSKSMIMEFISRYENYSRGVGDVLTKSQTNQGTSIALITLEGLTELWGSFHDCLSRDSYQTPGYVPDLLDKYPPNLPNTFYMVGYENLMIDQYIDDITLGNGLNFATLGKWSAVRSSLRCGYNIEARGLYPYNIEYELNPDSIDPKKTFLLKTLQDSFTNEYVTTMEMELDTPDMYAPITIGSL